MHKLVLCLTLAVLAAVLPGRAAEPTRKDLDQIERQLKALHETAGAGVACVVVSRSEKYPTPVKPPDYPGRLGVFDPVEFSKTEPDKIALARQLDLSDPGRIPDHGFAGGVVVDPAGLVLVNYHTIEGAAKIFVHLPSGKGSYADIHAADARSDLAVLKLLTPPEGLTTVPFAPVRLSDDGTGNPTVFKGKLVVPLAYALSARFAANGPRAALSSVTAVHRQLKSRDQIQNAPSLHRSVYDYTPVLEYDARVNLGYSGVALLNLDGQLVGLSTTTAGVGPGDAGVGYALPLDENVQRIIDTLRRGEEVEYGFLGVSLFEQTPGVVIKQVSPRSPAAAADLRPNYRIVRINGHRTTYYEDLLWRVGSGLAGTKVQLTIARPGQMRDLIVDVTLAKFKSDTPSIASTRPAPVFGLTVDYESVLSPTANEAFRAWSEIPAGVTVRDLTPDSPAAVKFKALGENNRWLITHVNDTPTPNPPAFYKAAKGLRSVKLTLYDTATDTPRPREVTLP